MEVVARVIYIHIEIDIFLWFYAVGWNCEPVLINLLLKWEAFHVVTELSCNLTEAIKETVWARGRGLGPSRVQASDVLQNIELSVLLFFFYCLFAFFFPRVLPCPVLFLINCFEITLLFSS